MFDWIKDNLVNDVKAIVDDDKRLLIKRRGEYFPEFIPKNADGKRIVVKTEGYEGQCAEITIDCTDMVIAGKEVPILLQATLKIKMFNKFLGEYANANWALFGKPILAGFEISENAEPKDIAQALYQALYDCVPENNRFMIVEHEEDSPIVKISLPDCYADFESFALESYDPTACDSCLGEYHRVEIAEDKLTIKHNMEPFATGAWIRENLRFPSYPNMRYAGLYADEQPIPGALYNMYAFKYVVPEIGHGGLSFVGQAIVSDTTHVFYVLAGEVSDAFEAELKKLGLEIEDKHLHTDENEEPLHPNGDASGEEGGNNEPAPEPAPEPTPEP